MKAWHVIALIIVELLVAGSMMLGEAPNLGKLSYRYQERIAALDTWHEHPSPATQAAYQVESERAVRYVAHRNLVRAAGIFAAFLVADAVLIYVWKVSRRRPTVA